MVKFVAIILLLLVLLLLLLCVYVCVYVCVCMVVFRGDIWDPFIWRDKVPSFLTIALVGLGKP